MATKTVVKTESRAFDHIYDPVTTHSHPADHNRLTARALVGNIKKVPSSQYYFSELPHYPRAQFAPTSKDLLGKDVFHIIIQYYIYRGFMNQSLDF